MSSKASLWLCLASFPFVYSTSFQVPLSAADQRDGPGLQKRERKRLIESKSEIDGQTDSALSIWFRMGPWLTDIRQINCQRRWPKLWSKYHWKPIKSKTLTLQLACGHIAFFFGIKGTGMVLGWSTCAVREKSTACGFCFIMLTELNTKLTTGLQHVGWKKHNTHDNIKCLADLNLQIGFSVVLFYDSFCLAYHKAENKQKWQPLLHFLGFKGVHFIMIGHPKRSERTTSDFFKCSAVFK